MMVYVLSMWCALLWPFVGGSMEYLCLSHTVISFLDDLDVCVVEHHFSNLIFR